MFPVVLNAIRTVKLFGWEPKMNEQLADKREDELTYLRRGKLLELSNGLLKYVLSYSVESFVSDSLRCIALRSLY